MYDAQAFYEQMADTFRARSGRMEEPLPLELSLRFYTVAAQLEALYAQSQWVLRQCFPQTAAGEMLDGHARLRGLSRHPAQTACGTIRFSVEREAGVELPIPAGTVCTTAELRQYETTEDGMLAAGQRWVDVPARAITAGSGGNTAAGTVTVLTGAPVGITGCTNPAPFTGGTDEETDENLRDRVLATYSSLNSGANAAYYRQAALSFDGVEQVIVLPRHRGIGTVDLYVAGPDGMPDPAVVSAVQEYFDREREISVDVKVSAPSAVSLNVSVRVEPEPGADGDAVCGRVKTAIGAFFNRLRPGDSLVLNRLGASLLNVEGVYNYRILTPTADQTVTPTSLPVAGTVTVTAGEV